jgi:N-hydroxyarylamine O-acetyltransferase
LVNQGRLDIDAYLRRIGYQGSRAPSAETLRQLQLAHLRAVPFENLSIHSAEPIVLRNDALFEKVVTRRRGGFCYELNGLFAALLRALGFEVEMLAAGVADQSGRFGPNFDHMTLLVKLDERWIADVGFGDSFLEPLRLDEPDEQVQDARAYKFTFEGDRRILWQRNYDGEWTAQYRFSLQPHIYADYGEMCRYHQTSPQSHFTRGRICTRATGDGRVTLSELRLINTNTKGERQERTLAGEDEYFAALREHFGITMTSDFVRPLSLP